MAAFRSTNVNVNMGCHIALTLLIFKGIERYWAYTGSILGPEFAIARLVLCLLFGIGIGLLMAMIFWRDDASHDAETDQLFAATAQLAPAALGVLLSLVGLLIAGTLKLWPLTTTLFTLELPLTWAQTWQATLLAWVPFDAAKGEEGVSFQGSVLIGLLLLIAITAWQGLENIVEGANRWTWVALGLTATTLLVAALRLTPDAGMLQVAFTGRVFGVALALWAVGYFAHQLTADDLRAWLWEAWRFVKQIFALLVLGVFIVGMVRQVIRPEWIESLAGNNSVSANAVAVGFGVFMYFPTLVEVPVARMFLDLGMHPGPLLAYLMADPELSLQSMLMVSAVIARTKTLTYVGLVAVFSVCAGLIYGTWVEGAGWWPLVTALGLFLMVLAGSLAWFRQRPEFFYPKEKYRA